MLPRIRLVLLGREAGADERARDVTPSVVGQWNCLAQHAARNGYAAPTERLLVLLAEAVEVFFLLDRAPVERLLDVFEFRVERAHTGRGVDVDHGRDALRHPIARRVAREPARA